MFFITYSSLSISYEILHAILTGKRRGRNYLIAKKLSIHRAFYCLQIKLRFLHHPFSLIDFITQGTANYKLPIPLKLTTVLVFVPWLVNDYK